MTTVGNLSSFSTTSINPTISRTIAGSPTNPIQGRITELQELPNRTEAQSEREFERELRSMILTLRNIEGHLYRTDNLPDDLRTQTQEVVDLTRQMAQGNFQNFNNNPICRFLRQRALYLITRNGAAFNESLPLRYSLQHDPVALQEYNRLVRMTTRRANFQWANIGIDDRGRIIHNNGSPVFTNLSSVDDSLKYFISAQIVEMLYYRPELIEALLNRRDGLRIRLSNNLETIRRQLEGSYNGRANTLHISIPNVCYLPYVGSNRVHHIMHEATHAIDYDDRTMEVDGLLAGMNDGQVRILLTERNRLQQFFTTSMTEHQARAKRGEPIGNTFRIFEEASSGLGRYALSNHNEFLAETVGFFFSNPQRLRRASPVLYNLYRDYFRLDPIQLRQGPSSPPPVLPHGHAITQLSQPRLDLAA